MTPVINGRVRTDLRPDPTGEPGCYVGPNGGLYVDDATWNSWVDERNPCNERAARRVPRTQPLEEIVARLRHEALSPIADPVENVVHALCPACGGREDGWRPLEVVPLPGRTVASCRACGARREVPYVR